MSFFHSHLLSAKKILTLYNGDMPFSIFIKNFFAKEKKYGSRDRKVITSLCYNYFRTGLLWKEKNVEDKLAAGVFLCNTHSNEWLRNVKPEWNDNITLPLQQKLSIAGINPIEIFLFKSELSDAIDEEAFATSFLLQPDLFVRIRPGKHSIVKQKLSAANISFAQIDESCLSFANSTKLDAVLQLNKEVVIQDLNSQIVGELMNQAILAKHAAVWDCCAASGGKSMMVYDLAPHIYLTASDIRQSIIYNLHKRFKEAGIREYKTFVADISNFKILSVHLADNKFDLILCDVPCSGSGTWSRTPEQLAFFNKNEIERYSKLQKTIAANASKYTKQGGYFLYITCSVFKKENEEVVDFIHKNTSLKLLRMNLLKGYEMKADTMFAALFQLNND